jgi:hypothetical protein
MSKQLNKLNCNNYHVSDASGDFWFACDGLRSLYRLSKCSNVTFKAICLELLASGQIIIDDVRDNENKFFVITLI